MKKNILVVDVGGSHVKMMISEKEKRRKFESGPKMEPKEAVAQIRELTADWKYDAVSIGFPAPVIKGKITREPKNLGDGWVGYDFGKSFGKPVRLINDAAMQALGSYRSGRVLFLGLGTGLGSALVWSRVVLSLELGDLPYIHNGTIEDQLGNAGLEELGKKDWERSVKKVITQLKIAFIAERVVLGGGNAKLVDPLPDGVDLGDNRYAYLGGVRLWETAAGSRQPKWQII
jgi:polyphosphate glucokinase